MIRWRTTLRGLQGGQALLRLTQIEFLKLRRRKLVWLMMLTALFMPLLGIFYFSDSGVTATDAMQFYKWSAFSYTLWIILPIVLGMFSTILMYEENQNGMLGQIWIIPVNKMQFFLSKFAVVMIYSVAFMIVTALVSVIAGTVIPSVGFDINAVGFLFIKCLEIGILAAIAMLPILAITTVQKGYILPICITLLYAFLGFVLLMVNMYLHPLSSVSAIVTHNIPGVVLPHELNICAASISIIIWAVASLLLANMALGKKSEV